MYTYDYRYLILNEKNAQRDKGAIIRYLSTGRRLNSALCTEMKLEVAIQTSSRLTHAVSVHR